jgi:site-specific DNA recombinase
MSESRACPLPEVGPVRDPRSAGVWGGSAVRAILINPRYLGRQVSGRQRRHDELLDTRDPALGTISRQQWQDPDAWAWSEQPSWPALVPADLFERVNKRVTNTHGNGTRRQRSQPGQYLLSGAIRCGHCGKAMYGNTAKSKSYYPCAATRTDYAAPSVPGHPPCYMVREERIPLVAQKITTNTACPGRTLGGSPLSMGPSCPTPASRTAAREIQKAHLKPGSFTNLPAWSDTEYTRLRDERRHRR